MGIIDFYHDFRYGRLTPIDEARTLLSKRGVDLDSHLPDFSRVQRRDIGIDKNPYAPPGTFSKERSEPGHEPDHLHQYIRGLKIADVGDGVTVEGEFFVQDIAGHKPDEIWKPGPLLHAPLKINVPKKAKR